MTYLPLLWVVLILSAGAFAAPLRKVQFPRRDVHVNSTARGQSEAPAGPQAHAKLQSTGGITHALGRHIAALVLGDRSTNVDPVTTRLIGRTVFMTAALIPVSSLLAVMVPAFVVLRGRRQRREVHRARIGGVRQELTVVVDMLRVAVSTGRSLPLAISTVCTSTSTGELSQGLAAAVRDIERGQRLSDGLIHLERDPVIGPEIRPLISALLAAERFGTPLPQVLGTLAEDVRDIRRRHAETAARKAPVRMLAPLVLLLLPSFALLTVAPLLAGGLLSLGLGT